MPHSLLIADPSCKREVVLAGAVCVREDTDEAIADAQEEAGRMIRVAVEGGEEARCVRRDIHTIEAGPAARVADGGKHRHATRRVHPLLRRPDEGLPAAL